MRPYAHGRAQIPLIHGGSCSSCSFPGLPGQHVPTPGVAGPALGVLAAWQPSRRVTIGRPEMGKHLDSRYLPAEREGRALSQDYRREPDVEIVT